MSGLPQIAAMILQRGDWSKSANCRHPGHLEMQSVETCGLDLKRSTRLMNSHTSPSLLYRAPRIIFVEIARNMTCGHVGTAPHLERTDIAVELVSTTAKRVAIVHRSSSVQQLVVRADVNVA